MISRELRRAGSVSLLAICACALSATSAMAQETTQPGRPVPPQAASEEPAPEPTTTEQAAASSEIVVTGSRLGASGFTAPTPVTVASAEALKASAPLNLADGLNQLPVFGGSTRAGQTGGGSVSGGTNGQNLLNMRNLGANRGLVLLDGRRLVATNQNGSVDINTLPQNLVQRVEVVTGGASAAYGSDAVAGVVNFILDTHFTGLKGEVTGGISNHADGESVLANLAFGHQFADGRVRLIAAGEYSKTNGIGVNDHTGRRWYDVPYGQIANPTTGALPAILVIPDIRSSIASDGGLILSGGSTLANMQFLPGGALAPFNPGTVHGATFQSGGDGSKVNNGLSPDQERWNVFGHVEADATDKLMLFAEGSYAQSDSLHQAFITQHVGGTGRFTIFRDNAYLPTAVRNEMVRLNLQSITVGRFFTEFPAVENENSTRVKRIAAGFQYEISPTWKLDGSYGYGQTKQHLFQNNRTHLRHIFAAVDAVVNPANGQIVCRSTLSGLDAGCVPLNIFGVGAPSAGAIAYSIGDSGKDLTLTQNVFAINLRGDLGDKLQFGAGPISLAVGAEYRRESAVQTADPVSQQLVDFTGVRGAPASLQGRLGAYQSNNPQPFQGKYNVKDFYGEIGIPILKDFVLARSLDLNGAIRRTEYSQSGWVTTWKLGGVWQIIDDIRLRYTHSQDIRGPNILELFNTQTQVQQNVIYKGQQVQDIVINSGNPNLSPERARTQTYGIVVTPTFLPGLSASIDRFIVRIQDAIGTISPVNTINLCEAGNQLLCNQITVVGPTNIIIRQQTLNLNFARVAGYDIEASYRHSFGMGSVQARILATHLTQAETEAVGSSAITTLGTPGTPDWRFTASLRYTSDRLNLGVQERYISPSVIDPALVQGVGTNLNHIPKVAYTDVNVEYKLNLFGGEQTIFASVNNLFDKAPPISGGNPTSFSVPADQAYDLMGRYFTAGLRFKF